MITDEQADQLLDMTRSRTFCWVWGLRGPAPQIIYNDPRTGCGGTAILPGTERKLDSTDARALDQLAAAYPAPKEAS